MPVVKLPHVQVEHAWSLSEDGKVDMHGYIYASSTTSITYCTPADQIV
jgi:hypothetical protein